ncbi:MAG: HAD family hydrolase [Dissulfuribacterales bacterium]
MGIRAIVFDFDGTLIDSNTLKYNAYFKLFPADDRHEQIIRSVLSKIFEKSRYAILEKILNRLGNIQPLSIKEKIGELALRYNEIVVAGAKSCPEKPGAEKALKKLTLTYDLYVSSTTPDADLKEIIQFRNWNDYFRAVFGYPHEKPATLKHIMTMENLTADEILVVGDGESDRESAMDNDCPFIRVVNNFCFENLGSAIASL